MNICVELVSNFVQIFILMYFITKSFGFKRNDAISKTGFVLVTLLAFLQLSFINYIVIFDGFLSGIVILTFIIYAKCFLKGNIFRQIFVIIFAMAIIYTLASVTLFFFSYITGITTQTFISEFSVIRIIMMSICRVLEFLIFKFILRINSEYSLTIKEWILFTCMPLLTWGAVTLMTDSSLKMQHIDSQMFYIAIMMVMIDIVTFFFMYKIKQDTKTKLEYELLKMNYNNIKHMETNMKALCENTYSVKHDLEKHLLAIKTLAEKNRCVDIGTYVDNIFDKNLNAIQKVVFTDNDIFNAVINTKLELCKQKGVFPSINISNDAISHIRVADIAVLFGNIFDNAIEATEKTDNKIIILNVQLQGEYVSIYMENSFNPKYSDINLETTKEDATEHGFGTKNVRKIVEEHNGMIQYFQNEAGMFCCDILLKKC